MEHKLLAPKKTPQKFMLYNFGCIKDKEKSSKSISILQLLRVPTNSKLSVVNDIDSDQIFI